MAVSAPCPSCAQLNDEAQRFCGHCGETLWSLCGSCGENNPPGFRFCGSCGAQCATDGPATSAPSADDHGERRWVTVMFADLSGFTALSERSDPEEMRAMVDGCMQAMGDVVDSFGGTVDKVIGDALMAVFGAPVAHEDDPERAVRAALEIQRSAQEHAALFGGLCVRIGINTGEVIFAAVGPDARRELTVIGDTVNTAARLQAAAPSAGILLGEGTHAACAHAIACEAVDPILAKGKQAPLRAWLAREITAAPAERPLSAAPFVGRDAEFELIAGAWTRSSGEQDPQLVTLVGPPGIGKTRLAREFAAHVQQDGGRTLYGRPLAYGETAAYWAFGAVIREACGILATDPTDVAARKLGERTASLLPSADAGVLARNLSILARLTEDTAEDRDALFASAQQFLEALAREQPTLVVFEDLHWADDSLVALIEAFSVRVAGVPLLLLAIARPEFLDARTGWARLPRNVTVQVQALTDGCAHDLVSRLLDGVADGEAVARRVDAAAGGNPLFIEELAGWLSGGGGEGASGAPTNLKSIIGARVDQLPASERQVILDASVVGDPFWLGSLRALGGDGSLAGTLQSLERKELIRRNASSRIAGDQELSFKHGLLREVAYATLPKSVRRQRHAVVARFIETAAGDPTAYAVILAHHWREAGEVEKAADYLLVAADQASRGWASHEAIELCNQALELIPEEDKPRQRRARLRRGLAAQAEFHASIDVPLADHLKSSGEMSPPIS